MDSTVYIFTDGAFNDISKDAGIGILVSSYIRTRFPEVMMYGSVRVTSSIEAELLAIYKALQYIYINQVEASEFQIGTDLIQIVEVFNEKIYEEWDKNGWVGTKKSVCKELIYKIRCLVELVGIEKIKFKKIKSNGNLMNKIAHRYARKGMKEKLGAELHGESYLYLLEKTCMDSKGIAYTEAMIDLNISDIENTYPKMPIKQIPQVKSKAKVIRDWLSEEIHNIVTIDISKVKLVDDIHLKIKELNLNGVLKKYYKEGIDKPILVRAVGEEYALVAGIIRFAACKILDIKEVKCVICDLNSHEEFIEKYSN